MTTPKPDSNLPGDAQKWRRWIEGRFDGVETSLAAITEELSRLSNSDGGQASLFASLKTGDIQTLYDQIQALYTATGNTYPPAPPAPKPKPVVPTYNTIRTTATWSRTWGSSSFYTGGGTYTDAHMLYQGSNPENKIGMWGVDVSSAAGKAFTDVQIFLQNSQFPWSSGGTAALGTHGFASPPSAKPGRSNGFDVGWAEGQGAWFGVPSWAWNGLSNGSIKGFTVGGIGPNDANSAIFYGVGTTAPPLLQITYQV